MGMTYEILATHYPFPNYYEKSFQTDNLFSALFAFFRFKKKGYEIIDIHYRAPIKFDTSNWNHITSNWSDEDE